ncbi:hypothetical protein O0L34_g3209 [Tuta absoluta]|nr:hypothetical protein O0L34_g3209 [Tuta absoluta]
MRSCTLVVFITYVSCMEMHETVERMVMVRTTGSDLHPAATGYIYKKNSDGPASVVEMGESEVVEHLSKMYELPKSFTAPIPIVAGPFYAKNSDDKIKTLTSESKLIPVVENQEDKDDPIDGIVNEDYGKFFEEYAGYENPRPKVNSYLKSSENLNDEIDTKQGFEEHKLSQDQYDDDDDSGKKDNSDEELYNTKTDGGFHSGKYESYRISEENGKKEEDYVPVAHKKTDDEYDKNKNYNFQPDKYSEGKAIDEFYKYFNSNEFPKDQGFYDREAYTAELSGIFSEEHKDDQSDNNRFDNKIHHSGNTAFKEGDSHGKENNSKPREDFKPSKQYFNEDSFRNGKYDGGSYSYKIKH